MSCVKIVFVGNGLVWGGDGGSSVTALGALGYGLVLGWASAFVAPTRAGLMFRALAIGAAAIGLIGFGWMAALLGFTGAALGMAAHELLVVSIGRRVA